MNFNRSLQVTGPITEGLGQDHDRLAEIETSAFAARERGDFAAGGELFERFARDLESHIVFEEERLFPVVEQEMGLTPDSGPTAVMREEHAQIRSLLREISGKMRDAASSVEEKRRTLELILEEHNMKEEEMLYPMTDQVLGQERAGRLAGELRREF